MTAKLRLVQPRNQTPEEQALLNDGVRRYRDGRFAAQAVKVLAGEQCTSRDPGEMLVAVLGACVAACIRDPDLGFGGMNHFMLPVEPGRWGNSPASVRYGIATMDRLIREIVAAGGRRDRLEIKIFGGANLLLCGGQIGHRNADFLEGYLSTERLPVASHQLRGELPRRLHYFPATGKAMILKLRRDDDLIVVDNEERYEASLRQGLIEEPDQRAG